MLRFFALAAVCAMLCSCQGTVDKVMADFGLKERPEGYVSGADKVMQKLNDVGVMEMKRMNMAERQGTVKFQKENDLRGKYYKEVKVYESYYPTDAQPVNRANMNDGGFVGYLEYGYRLHQSVRKDTSAEAAAQTADIPTDTTGRETYRYTFSSSGEWNGAKGERTRN